MLLHPCAEERGLVLIPAVGWVTAYGLTKTDRANPACSELCRLVPAHDPLAVLCDTEFYGLFVSRRAGAAWPAFIG